MTLYKQFKADSDAEANGVWLTYGETDDKKPIRFLVARAGGSNIRFNKALEKKSRPYRRQIQSGTILPETLNQITLEVYCESIILNWENVQSEDGKELSFNKENCMQLMTDLPDLYDDIVGQSQRLAVFKAEAEKEDAKN